MVFLGVIEWVGTNLFGDDLVALLDVELLGHAEGGGVLLGPGGCLSLLDAGISHLQGRGLVLAAEDDLESTGDFLPWEAVLVSQAQQQLVLLVEGGVLGVVVGGWWLGALASPLAGWWRSTAGLGLALLIAGPFRVQLPEGRVDLAAIVTVEGGGWEGDGRGACAQVLPL